MKLKVGPKLGVRLEGDPCCETGGKLVKRPGITEITEDGGSYFAIDFAIEDSYLFTARLNYCSECGEKIEYIRVKSVG